MTRDALTAAVVEEVLRVPAVERVYPRDDGLGSAMRTAAALVRPAGGRLSVDVGLRPGSAALSAGLDCIAAARRAMPPDRAATAVRIRIVAVD